MIFKEPVLDLTCLPSPLPVWLLAFPEVSTYSLPVWRLLG